MDAPDIFIESRKSPICEVAKIVKGSIPVDDGNFLLSNDEYEDFIKKEPSSIEYIKPYYGAREFLHNEKRYCLWLENISPSALMKSSLIKERVWIKMLFVTF